jgi:hypothetical protein
MVVAYVCAVGANAARNCALVKKCAYCGERGSLCASMSAASAAGARSLRLMVSRTLVGTAVACAAALAPNSAAPMMVAIVSDFTEPTCAFYKCAERAKFQPSIEPMPVARS